MSALKINAPTPINGQFNLSTFNCGDDQLNAFLNKRALKNEGKSSRTYVVGDTNNNVIGYYTLSLGSLAHEKAPGRVKRNSPNPIPVMVLGRLAVDQKWQNQKIGQSMLKDAIFKTIEVSKIAGVKALMLHAISNEAKNYYLKFGFYESPIDEMTMMITLTDAINALKE